MSAQSTAPTRGLGRPRTLRTRLVLVIITLVTLTSVMIGGASVVALNSFFTQRLDDQLTSAGQRSQAALERGEASDARAAQNGGGRVRPPPNFLLTPGQGPGTLGALIEGDTVSDAAVLDEDGSPQALPEDADAALLSVPTDGEPHTVELGVDLGDFRAVAVQVEPQTRVVTALSRAPAREAVSEVITVIAISAAIALALAALAAAAIVRSTLRPLRRVADMANQVATMPLGSGEVLLAPRVPEGDTDRGTEVGQVGAAFNQMLANVEDALSEREMSQQRMRQFVADASHELRTPLASILGYSELIRRGPTPLPAETDHALGRVESQAQRMNILVEDLLLLARLDADPQMQCVEVDLRTVVADAVSDAQVAGRGHQWSLVLPQAAVLANGDSDRLHQVVANVLRNAHRHTPVGTTVTTSLQVRGDRAELSVHDDGPGIPADLQPHVFERFARGDTSRSPAAGSTGLGLAIVAAIVTAHHGSVEVSSKPGDTTFVIRLALGQTGG